MRLLIVSQMPHHVRDGRVVGWGATVRELDHLATRFDRVRHVATLHPGPAPATAIPYRAENLEVVAVPPSGADGALGKLDALWTTPAYVRTIARELRTADVVHIRAPARVALLAMLALIGRKAPRARWIKYAGNWNPTGPDSPSYALQRWLLRCGVLRAAVTVAGEWPDQPPWIRAFFNPSLDASELAAARARSADKRLTSPIQLVFVGQVNASKGAGRAVQIVARLRDRGVEATLVVVGDGPERAEFERMAAELGVGASVQFRGWLPPSEVYATLAVAHVLVLPSASEGWPKVLSEGMAHGVVPVAGAVSSIPQYLERFGVGTAVAPDDLDGAADAVARYAADPARWQRESARGLVAAQLFSFEHYLEAVDQLLLDLELPMRDPA